MVLPALVLSLSSSFGSSGDSVIGQLFSCEMENCSMCRCGKETVRVSSTLLFTLSYPESTGNSLGALVTQGAGGAGAGRAWHVSTAVWGLSPVRRSRGLPGGWAPAASSFCRPAAELAAEGSWWVSNQPSFW